MRVIGKTEFQVFTLMASRRLQGDRFFNKDFRAEVYTQEGIQWVADATMKSVLLRNYPDLAKTSLGNPKVVNAFAPWKEGGFAPVPAPTK